MADESGDALDALMGSACTCLFHMISTISPIRGVLHRIREMYHGEPGCHHLPEILRHVRDGEQWIRPNVDRICDLDRRYAVLELVRVANLDDAPEFPLRAGRYRTWTEALSGVGAVSGTAHELLETLNFIEATAEASDLAERQRIDEIANSLRPWRKLTQRFADRWNLRIQLECDRAIRDAPATGAADGPSDPPKAVRSKRSTTNGDARAKLVAAFTTHHKYADGSCLNLEPIGNNELARSARVAKRTASDFFAKLFHGHAKYRALCSDPPRLAAALKAMNGEFQPHDFYTARTPDEFKSADDDE